MRPVVHRHGANRPPAPVKPLPNVYRTKQRNNMRQTSHLVRGRRTTPLREYREVKPTPPSEPAKLAKEPRQIHWLAYFGGLLALLAVLSAFVQPNGRSIPQ